MATRAARAAQSAVSQAANAQLHRERTTVLGPSARSRQITSEALIRLTKNQIEYEANHVSASREVPVAWQASDFKRRFAGIGCGFTGAVGQSVSSSFCCHSHAVASLGTRHCGRKARSWPAWAARSGKPSRRLTKITKTSGTLRFLPLPHRVMPNPSLEARPNIKTPGPRSGLAHFPPRGPGVLLSVPPQLER